MNNTKEEKWLPSNEKIDRMKKLYHKLSVLKEKRSSLNTEAREWAEKRNKLNEQVKNLRIEIRKLKSNRDDLNKEVEQLKKLRQETKTAVREEIQEMRNIRQQIAELTDKRPFEDLQTLQKRLEEVEWEIQTTPLSLKEEKELVDYVGQLENKIKICKNLKKLDKKIVELQTELKAKETRNKFFHEKLTERAQKSQEFHNKMLEKINEVNRLKIEADNMHKKFLKKKQSVEPTQKEITKILNQIKLVKEKIRKEEEKEQNKKEEILRKKVQEKAKAKLKRGEKLSWEEFQILAQKEKTTQD